MAINFPDSPNNGENYTVSGTTFVYNSAKNKWSPASPLGLAAVAMHILPDNNEVYDLGSANKKFRDLYLSGNTLNIGAQAISADDGGIVMPAVTIGSGTNKVVLAANADGGLTQTGTNSAGVTAPAKEAGAAKTVTDMPGLIALTGMATGETCLVTSLNRIFMYTGTGWFKIADMTNASPTAITGVAETISLATDGTATTITAVSTDPEGFPLTWSYAVTTGSLGSTATVSQGTGANTNVFTITPSTVEANAGTFSITFSVTDGATGAVNAVSAFTLAFATDIEIAAFTANGNTISASTTGAISVTMTNNSNSGPGTMPLHDAPLKLGKRYIEIKILSLTVPNGLYYDFGFVNHAQAVAGTLGSMGGSVSGFAALAAWWGGSSMYGTNQNAGWAVAAGLTVPNTAAGWVNATWMFAYDTTAKKGWIGINGNWETGSTSYLGGDPTGSGVGSDLSSLASGNFGIVMGNGSGSGTSTSVTAQWMTGPSGGTPTYSPPTGFLHYN